jgi:hypothetical protein
MWRAPVIFVLMMVAFALVGGPPKQATQQPASAAEHQARTPAQPMARAFQQLQEASQHDQPCAYGNDNRASDLCAQWKAADAAQSASAAAWWIGILGSVIGAFTLAAAWAAARWAKKAAIHTEESAVEASRAATAMQTQNELTLASQRPWIKLDARVTKFDLDDEGIDITTCIAIEATNIGKSVALDVRMDVVFEHDHTLSDGLLERVRRRATTKQGVTIIPGDKQTHWSETMTMINESKLIGGDVRLLPFKAFAAVIYRVPGDPEEKVSEKAFMVTEATNTDRFKHKGIRYPVSPDLKP